MTKGTTDNPREQRSLPCPHCGYDLQGSIKDSFRPIVCPECNTRHSHSALKQARTRSYFLPFLLLGTLIVPGSTIVSQLFDRWLLVNAQEVLFVMPCLAHFIAPIFCFLAATEWTRRDSEFSQLLAAILAVLFGVMWNLGIQYLIGSFLF